MSISAEEGWTEGSWVNAVLDQSAAKTPPCAEIVPPNMEIEGYLFVRGEAQIDGDAYLNGATYLSGPVYSPCADYSEWFEAAPANCGDQLR